MSRFWTKLHICLSEPRKLGFFMGEKKWKSLIQLFLFLVLALTPYLIRISVDNEISSSSKSYLETILMTEEIDAEITIKDGKLIGNDSVVIGIDEGIIFINPVNHTLDNSDYEYLPVFELKESGVIVSLMGSVIKEISYEELGYLNIDFNQIFRTNYIEFNTFISLINDVYNSSRGYWNCLNYLILLVTSYLTLLFSAFVIALFGGSINKFVSFKFRFKGALDAQFISVVFILLAHLFSFIYLELIGMLLSIFYFIRGLMAIVRIEIRKVDNKEGK